MKNDKDLIMSEDWGKVVLAGVFGIFFLVDLIVQMTSGEHIRGSTIYLLIACLHYGWRVRAKLVEDEFTRKTLADGFAWGTFAVILAGTIIQWLVAEDSPISYALEGAVMAGSTIYLFAVIYSWWKLR
jgi:hypothetical protein